MGPGETRWESLPQFTFPVFVGTSLGGRGLCSLVIKTADALTLGKQATQALLVCSSFTM